MSEPQPVRLSPLAQAAETLNAQAARAAYARRLGDVPGTETIYRLGADGLWREVKVKRP